MKKTLKPVKSPAGKKSMKGNCEAPDPNLPGDTGFTSYAAGLRTITIWTKPGLVDIVKSTDNISHLLLDKYDGLKGLSAVASLPRD